MTPERIEEIKNVAGISDEWALEKIVNELLAALEESQQQQEIVWNSLTKSRETLKSKRHVLKDEIHRLQTQLSQANEKIDALDIKLEESEQKLAIEEERKEGYWAERYGEAQQTIARYKEALNIAMTQNQNHDVFRSIQELTGEGKS